MCVLHVCVLHTYIQSKPYDMHRVREKKSSDECVLVPSLETPVDSGLSNHIQERDNRVGGGGERGGEGVGFSK